MLAKSYDIKMFFLAINLCFTTYTFPSSFSFSCRTLHCNKTDIYFSLSTLLGIWAVLENVAKKVTLFLNRRPSPPDFSV